MKNAAVSDISSPVIRVRYFSGRSAEQIAADLPILPVDAPGMPPPGQTLRAYAAGLGDVPPADPPAAGKRTARKTVPPAGPYLTALVRSLLYIDPTGVRLAEGGEDRVYYFLPGLTAHRFPTRPEVCGVYGPMPARLMVVGKCLGPTEEAGRRPYSGPGSRPLWEAWAEAGLPEPTEADPAYLTNLIRFAPPAAAMTRLPRDWVADGVHLLHQEIAQVRPEVLWLLGADALKALFGVKAKVEDYRGRVTELRVDCRGAAGEPEDTHVVRVVVSDHPAAVARDPDRHPLLVQSARAVAELLGHASRPSQVPLDYQALYTVQELARAVDESCRAAEGGGYLAFDCEWEGGHPSDPGSYLYTVQWSHAPGHARVAFLRRCGGAPNPSLPREAAVTLLQKLFCQSAKRGARLVGHFAKADLPWLDSIGVDLYPYYVGPGDYGDVPAADRTYYAQAFDTFVAAHAVDESATLKLEVLCANVLGADRWDVGIMAWRDEYCRANKLSRSKLGGYGNCPEAVLFPYGAADADYAGRLYLHLNGDPRAGTRGTLDADRAGNSARQIFAVRMRAWAAWAEMERVGLEVDVNAHRTLRGAIVARRTELIAELRREIGWEGTTLPDGTEVAAFDPAKPRHRVEFLFGEEYLDVPSVRPPGALSLYLTPFKATDTTGDGKLWDDAVARCVRQDRPRPKPAADKETMIHLARQHKLAALLRDIDFLGTATKIMFRLPDEEVAPDPGDWPAASEADKVEVHERGLMAELCGDGRVRSTFGLVETGRASSSRPNLQNVTGAVDDHYNRILAWGAYADRAAGGAPAAPFVSRSLFRARAGWYLVGADLMGAEIAAAAWSSGDPLLIEHARRNTLKESDPDWLDLHSDLAKTAFNLDCSLAEVKKKYKPLRVAAKRARFGHYYGASPETILRQALEESADVTLDQIRAIVEAHDRKYPVLAAFFAACRKRVHSPGWMRNGLGGLRRFRRASDRDLVASQEREAQNWSCQGLVADVMNTALGNLWLELKLRRMRSRIVLSVHDSVMLECPPAEVPTVVDVLLPLCITQRAPVVPATLDGHPVARGPYHFGIDVEVCRSWGVDVPEAEWRTHAAAALAV